MHLEITLAATNFPTEKLFELGGWSYRHTSCDKRVVQLLGFQFTKNNNLYLLFNNEEMFALTKMMIQY